MNINQMKSAISKFRKANLSVIKDEKLRAKGQKLQGKEKGFTLLELLVVITLIAILATGALVAYEDIGENAEAASAGNTAATLDRAVRTYRAVENLYPNQWDNLVDAAGDELTFAPVALGNFTAPWATPVSSAPEYQPIVDAFVNAGFEELQVVNAAATLAPGDAPNRFHNESSGDSLEVELEDGILPTGMMVVPNDQCGGELGIPAATTNGISAVDNNFQNQYGDALEGDECHLLVALGFGGDAAASTTFSNVAIAQSPTYLRNTGNDETTVDPSEDYARFIGLYQVGEFVDSNGDDILDTWEWNDTVRLITFVSTDGNNIDQLVAEAQ